MKHYNHNKVIDSWYKAVYKPWNVSYNDILKMKGNGRFYYPRTQEFGKGLSKNIYFEHKEDAIVFTLKYA